MHSKLKNSLAQQKSNHQSLTQTTRSWEFSTLPKSLTAKSPTITIINTSKVDVTKLFINFSAKIIESKDLNIISGCKSFERLFQSTERNNFSDYFLKDYTTLTCS